MASFKISSIVYLSMMLGASSYITAMENDRERMEEKENMPPRTTPNISSELADNIPELEISSDYRVLKLGAPLFESDLDILRRHEYKEMYLHCVYKTCVVDGHCVDDGSLTISPEVFSPTLEILSLRVCGLSNKEIRQIDAFKHLRKLILDCNRITDKGVNFIILIKNLTSLSIMGNNIGNAGLMKLLEMPKIEELDVSHNGQINDDMVPILMDENKLKKLNVRTTGMSRENQRKINNKYRATFNPRQKTMGPK